VIGDSWLRSCSSRADDKPLRGLVRMCDGMRFSRVPQLQWTPSFPISVFWVPCMSGSRAWFRLTLSDPKSTRDIVTSTESGSKQFENPQETFRARILGATPYHNHKQNILMSALFNVLQFLGANVSKNNLIIRKTPIDRCRPDSWKLGHIIPIPWFLVSEKAFYSFPAPIAEQF
jgi:hypothetical protein